ncbi:MAG TPA: hypothetical protein VMW55_02105 [Nitrosopumilaceae archaeon]|jgi:hypothetical protein|nr:hypothetical protein [Nitrosopumilaceae archaeon]
MKSIFYGIIPIVAILIIFMNMLYGHTLLVSASEQVANKYEVYVHLQPDWNIPQKNILFEITNYWDKVQSSEPTFEKNVVNHNYNELRYLGDKSYVELKHDFSDCQDEWQPMLYRKAVDTVRHEIEFFQGKQLSADPEISIYPDIENESYDKAEQQLKIRDGFSQFIPICTSKEHTSYDYSIKTDSNDVGFDVYFVPSIDERSNFHNSENDFDFYTADGCYAKNKKSFSGFCDNVGKNGGLLIIIPDALNKPVTKFFITLKENKI